MGNQILRLNKIKTIFSSETKQKTMKFTIATLTAVMLSLTTLEVNAMKLNKNM